MINDNRVIWISIGSIKDLGNETKEMGSNACLHDST